MTADIGERLAEAIEAAAAPVTLEEAVVRGRRQQWRRRAMFAAVIVSVVGGGGGLFAATRPSGQSRLNVAATTTPAPSTAVAAPLCTAADLRRPWPAMPQPTRVATRYVLDGQTHIRPAPSARPRVSAARAWLAAKVQMTSPTSLLHPPAGGTGSLLFGYLASDSTVPSTHLLAWVIILHNTALNALKSRSERVTPPPNPPCYFGQEYLVIDANTGKWIIGGAKPTLLLPRVPAAITTPAATTQPGGVANAPNTTTTTRPSSSHTADAPCAASQMTALPPEWASPLSQQKEDLLRFTNTGTTCTLSGYPPVVAAAPGRPDIPAQPGIPVFPAWNGTPIAIPHGSTAQLLVAALVCYTDTPTTSPYTALTVTMPGGGSIMVTLPNKNVSPNPDQNGRDLTLQIGPSCPPHAGYFGH
ncbi:MAG: hypothetical protein ACLPVY_03200 [Acidimicrobiia bacterium]